MNTKLSRSDIPADYEVRPLTSLQRSRTPGATTCGTCGLTWDDDVVTGITPAPSARCPFEPFHRDNHFTEETPVRRLERKLNEVEHALQVLRSKPINSTTTSKREQFLLGQFTAYTDAIRTVKEARP